MKVLFVCLACVSIVTSAGWFVLKGKHKITRDEAQLLEWTNAARAQQKLPPLAADTALCTVARANAERLARQGALSLPSQKAMAEELKSAGYEAGVWSINIDALRELNVPAIGENWLAALPTRGELLKEQYQECGIGIAHDPGKTRYYFTMVLATKKK
jgi:uncharacterized protein YkwD